MESNEFMSRGRVSNQTTSEAASQHSGGRKGKGRWNPMRIVMGVMVVAVALLAVAVLAFLIFGGNKTDSQLIKEDQYQAVFLDDQNGQVYFGKLDTVNAKYYRLTDIFYVRVEQVQPDSGEAQQNISLAKLGNELHGPEDEMFIAKDKVLFWENLKGDGKVVTAIKDFKANGSKDTSSDSSSTESSGTDSTIE